ncbi:expressed protein [Chlorella variabilis]|uniref:Expressed protein n=1 Tax=Chlorella variabilis TaxID=554065 RepID=E1ZKD8_CHLVA|nr:expressed protein [Chlorella variabilis]EFN53674.1 expressed protein [Chlorella variabilis]|eukprot:XP_005845776.1 expressed protein [Chlorella variabilis]
MEPGVPAPPLPGEQLDSDMEWKVGLPHEGDFLSYETPAADAPPASGGQLPAAASAPAPAPHADEGPSMPKKPSEDDILVFGQRVHVHGELAKKEVHPPQHAPKNLNYAAVAREEIHDVAVHPPPVKLMGGETGVQAWDKVNSPKVGRAKSDIKELLVPGAHSEEP